MVGSSLIQGDGVTVLDMQEQLAELIHMGLQSRCVFGMDIMWQKEQCATVGLFDYSIFLADCLYVLGKSEQKLTGILDKLDSMWYDVEVKQIS